MHGLRWDVINWAEILISGVGPLSPPRWVDSRDFCVNDLTTDMSPIFYSKNGMGLL